MTFVFKFKRKGQLRWRTRRVTGYRSVHDQDRMTLYFEDGGVEEIPEWSQCWAKLGQDWVLAVKKQMEKEAGQAIPLNV